MRSAHTTTLTCTKSLKLLADFWTLRIIESLSHESLRYCEIQRAVGNVNPTTLSKKLDLLENTKLVIRKEDGDGLAVHYALTPLGQRALPVLQEIRKFAAHFS